MQIITQSKEGYYTLLLILHTKLYLKSILEDINMKSKNIVWAAALCISLTAPSFSYSATFSDLGNTNWARPAIEEMSKMGYIGGYEDGTFKPSKEITRAELLTIINKMNNFTEEAEITFTDVSSTNWAYREIRKAVAAGYVAGFNDNTFKPNENVTREQIAVMLNNLYKLEEKDRNINIADIDQIASWAKTAVKNVVSNGIMNGYSDGTFGGKRRITRAEGVVALHNISNSDISIVSNEKPNDIVTNQEENKDTNKTTSTGSTGGGGGGASGSGGSSGGNSGGSSGGNLTPSEQQAVNTKLNEALAEFNKDVKPNYVTDRQKEAGQIIATSIQKYLNNSSYDISEDVQRAKDIARQMSENEKKQFELITTGNMELDLLVELNKTFNLIKY